MNKKFSNFKTKILDLFFPRHVKCVFCSGELNEKERFDTCEICKQTLPFITFSCPRCGGSVGRGNSGVCLDCKRNNYDFDFSRAVFDYEGKVLNAIHKFKYDGQKFLAEPLGNYLCEKLAVWGVEFDIVTYVPMHPKKEKQRGYNQAKLLAEFVANMFGAPCLPLTEKVKETPSQTALNYTERKSNILDSFKFNPKFKDDVKNKSILLIDDIFTTGSTCSEIARILKAHGAQVVNVLTVAHTKLKDEK